MKRVGLIILICLLTLTGCMYQGSKRPELSDTEVWICEEPYLELYWDTERKYTGKLIVDEVEYSVIHTADFGASVWICENVEGIDDLNRTERMDYCLFEGEADYGKKKLTLQVVRDYKDVFKGEFPKFELIKYNKDEYFKNKSTTPTKLTGSKIKQVSKPPKLSDSEVWISEDPYLELYWDTERKYTGKLIACGTEYSIRHEREYHGEIWFYENVEDLDKISWEEKWSKHLMFQGQMFCKDDKISLYIIKDYKNIFKGERPDIELVKYNIDDYFKEK